jgi:thiamine-phosphate pyrophosphorylase
VDAAAACLDGGASWLQIRAKRAAGAAFLDLVERVVARAMATRARVIVNDRPDIARLAGAAGVHVGQDDVPAAAARAIVGEGAIVGLSTHTDHQVARALDAPIDYLAIGPVFGTATKDTGYGAVGLDAVGVASRRAGTRQIPVVGIGGITLENAVSVIDAGAQSVAVVSDLLTGGDPAVRVGRFLRALG